MKLIAIDAGWGGAVACWIPRRKIAVVKNCPPDCIGMLDFIRELKREYGSKDWFALIEANSPTPRFGARGNFGLGLNIGSWESALTSEDIVYESINPKTWQKLVSNERSKHKKDKKKAGKEKAWKFARRTYPKLREELGDTAPSVTNPKQGRADALCILEYGRRNYGRKTRQPKKTRRS